MADVEAKNPGEPEFHQAVREVAESVELVLERRPRYRDREGPRAPGRARARGHVPRPVGRRPRRHPDQPRLPRRDEQRHRPLQGRPALPSQRLPGAAEVPRVRAGLQERAHDAPDGRRQGRLELRPARQERRRGHALLPVVHDRAAAPHRPVHRRPRRRHRRGRPGDRVPVRPVQAHQERVHRRPDRQGHQLGRLVDPHRGDRLRRRVLRAADARHARRRAGGQDVPRIRVRQRRAVHHREAERPGRERRHAVGLLRLHPRPRRHQQREARVGQGAEERAPRPHLTSTRTTSPA